MCDPVTTVTTALTVGSKILGGRKQKKAADAAAAAEEQAAFQEAELIRKAARQVRGEARTAYAGSGVVVDEGTPLIVDRQITEDSELDALNTILSGQRRGHAIRKGGSAAAMEAYGSAASALAEYGRGGGWKRPKPKERT